MTAVFSIASTVVLAAAVLSGTLAIAHVAATPAHRQTAAEQAEAQPRQVTIARKRSHCGNCGVIQAIRRVDAADGHPPTYEITIRLRDGSTRTNSNATPGNWRAGDRIMLINGGHAAPAPTT
jgi:hypothetical protein